MGSRKKARCACGGWKDALSERCAACHAKVKDKLIVGIEPPRPHVDGIESNLDCPQKSKAVDAILERRKAYANQ
jgi:hypothetical protein